MIRDLPYILAGAALGWAIGKGLAAAVFWWIDRRASRPFRDSNRWPRIDRTLDSVERHRRETSVR